MIGRSYLTKRENEIERGARWLPLIDYEPDGPRAPVPLRPLTGRRSKGGVNCSVCYWAWTVLAQVHVEICFIFIN